MGNTNAPSTAAEPVATTSAPSEGKKEQGKVIAGRYRLEDKLLGSGAFAIVKLGTDLVENKHVAIRIIDKEKLTPVSMSYLRKEMEIYPTLSHPHIVQCYYCKEGKKYVIMIVEYAPDGNLSTHLSHRAMVREMEARDIFDQVLRAVEYLHGKNIAWRDLKCSNILLNLEKNLVKICDFGFADYTDKPFTDFPGTMAYSPPEVVSATPYLGGPRDVWSFGVLLFKLLMGSYPFGTKTNVATKDRIITEELNLESLPISDEAQDLLKQLLTKDPTKRITLTDIRKHAWMTSEHLVAPKRRALSSADGSCSPGRPASTSPMAIHARASSPKASPRTPPTLSPLALRTPATNNNNTALRGKQLPRANATQEPPRKTDALDARAERATAMGGIG